MGEMRRAYSILTVKSVDEDARIIEGIASTPTPDRMGDIVEPEGAVFKLPLPLLWQHDASKPVGAVEWAKPTKTGIPFKARFAKGVLPYIDEAWALVKAGLVRGMSIGFKPIEYSELADSYGLRFTSYEWLELSCVTIPANAECSITTIKAADAATLAALGRKGGAVVRLDAPSPGATGTTSTKQTKGAAMPKPIREQIAAFEAKRAAHMARMSSIMDKSSEDNRTLDEAEQEEYDGLQIDVKNIDAHLARMRDHEKAAAATASAVSVSAGTDPADAAAHRQGSSYQARGSAIVSVRPNVEKGTAFTRYAMLLAASRGNLTMAAEMAKRFKDSTPEVETVLKAAVAAGTTSDATWAAPLVDYTNMASEFIELLRPATIVGRIQGFRQVPFNVRMPRQTSGASASWVGQAKPKPVSSLAFDTVELPWSKISVIIALTDELVRFSNPSAEALCRADMIEAISKYSDEQFVDPDIALSAGVNPASITNGVTPTPSTGSTVAAITTDVQTLFNRFVTAGHQTLRAGVWVMHPRTALYLSMLRTSQDIFAFPGITMTGGTWFGLPVVTSASVPLDQGSPSASMIVLADASEILLADDGQVTLDVSREASLQMDTAPDNPVSASTVMVSMWQHNMVALRAERYIHWLKRRASAAVWLGGVTY